MFPGCNSYVICSIETNHLHPAGVSFWSYRCWPGHLVNCALIFSVHQNLELIPWLKMVEYLEPSLPPCTEAFHVINKLNSGCSPVGLELLRGVE